MWAGVLYAKYCSLRRLFIERESSEDTCTMHGIPIYQYHVLYMQIGIPAS